MALKSDLHYSNYRNEHHQIPKPADNQIWILSSTDERNRGHRDYEGNRNREPPNFHPVFRMDIKWNQIGRPKHLADVLEITEQRVSDSPLQRQKFARAERKILRP